MKNMSITWWQSIKGGGTSSWSSAVGSNLTAVMSGTNAKVGQCTIWWIAYSGDKSQNFAIRNWQVIGSKCP
jgi:hypothetical protein